MNNPDDGGIENQNLMDFQTDTHAKGAGRRSSILKVWDNFYPEDRRISKRISFHGKIQCQQILPDGTTQIIHEALKAKLPESSVSSISDSSEHRVSKSSTINTIAPEPSTGILVVVDENQPSVQICTGLTQKPQDPKRKSAGESKENVPQKKNRKDPKEIAKSYQNLMKKTYDVQDENDYDTLFNTSVNRRNGKAVGPRDARLDVTKLFSTGDSDGNMDVSGYTAPTHVETPTPPVPEGDLTQVFSVNDSNAAMSLEGDLIRLESDLSSEMNEYNDADQSEMDTAMILNSDLSDDVFTSPDGPKGIEEKQMVITSIFEHESIDDISMSISEPEPPASILQKIEGAADDSNRSSVLTDMSIEETTGASLDSAKSASGPKEDDTKFFGGNKTEAVMSIEPAASDPSPPNSQGSSGVQSMITSSMNTVDENVFSQKSASFQRRQSLSQALSRYSFPRIDQVLKLRKEQFNQTFKNLQNQELSSSIDSYSDSPQINPIRAPFSPHITTLQKGKSPVRKFSLTSTPSKSGSSFSFRPSITKDSIHTSKTETPKTEQKITSPEKPPSDKQQPDQQSDSSPKELEGNEMQENYREDNQSRMINRREMFTTMILTSFDSDESSIEEPEVNFDKSYNIPVIPEDPADDDSRDESSFEVYRKQESSFMLSPDSSFQSSFIIRDDTLCILAEDLDSKLKSIIEAPIHPDNNIFTEQYVPLTRFDSKRYGASFESLDDNLLTVTFLYGTLSMTVNFGETIRSLNGIPIKLIQKMGLESHLRNDDSLQIQNSMVPFKDEHKIFFRMAHDLIISKFDGSKSCLLKKFQTSDMMSDLLSEVGEVVLMAKDMLLQLTSLSIFIPWHLYKRTDQHTYEISYELPGRNRNFFLILPINPHTFQQEPIRPRFGFYRCDLHLYCTASFSKALEMVVKPGPQYLKRLVDGAKKYVYFSRKISRRNVQRAC